MMDVGDWKTCTVSTADRLPIPLAMLTAVVPVLGVGLHQEGIHGRCKSGFQKRILKLIAEIEKEDWGIDLIKQKAYVGNV